MMGTETETEIWDQRERKGRGDGAGTSDVMADFLAMGRRVWGRFLARALSGETRFSLAPGGT